VPQRTTSIQIEAADVAFLERRGARSQRGGGEFSRSVVLHRAIRTLGRLLEECDPRRTRRMPEAEHAFLSRILPEPWALTAYEIDQLADRMGRTPGFRAAATEAGLDPDALLATLGEALALVERALDVDWWGQRVSLLVTKAKMLEEAGDYAGSMAVARDAAHQVGEEQARNRFLIHFYLVLNLCHLGRHAQARLELGRLRALAGPLGNRLDLVRVDWLAGRVAAGLGEWQQAVVAFARVRDEMRRQRIAYDTALVTVELAEAHLALHHGAEVRALARQSASIFADQGVHREARRALQLFRRAAEQERATVELARRVVAYLYRARRDPRLRFREAGS
jgi:hypothetical protein